MSMTWGKFQRLGRVAAMVIWLFALILLTGCSKPQPPTFHVTSVDTCARPQLVGMIGKMRYALNVPDEKYSAVACPNFGMDLNNIGKDYPAVVDLDHHRMTITVPVHDTPTVEEWKAGKTEGSRVTLQPQTFVIQQMEEQ